LGAVLFYAGFGQLIEPNCNMVWYFVAQDIEGSKFQ